MWRGWLLKEKEIKTIYFDAFKNDYQKDPFLAIAAEIYQLIKIHNTDAKEKFKKGTINVAKVFGRAALMTGVKILSAGALDNSYLEDLKITTEAAKDVSNVFDKVIGERLEKAAEDNMNIVNFKKNLFEFAKSIGDGKPVIFIIDELDRCKPSFSLKIIEIIKHFYSVKNIVFILVMNRSQMEAAVRCEYGTGIDAEKYLQKFVNLWANLPKNKEGRGRCDTKNYLMYCLERMGFPLNNLTDNQYNAINEYEILVDAYNMSLRDIEQSLTNYAIFHNLTEDLKTDYQYISIYLSIIKVLFPHSYRRISEDEITYQDLYEETKLNLLQDTIPEIPEKNWLRFLLLLALSEESEANEFRSKVKWDGRNVVTRDTLKSYCKWLNSFSTM